MMQITRLFLSTTLLLMVPTITHAGIYKSKDSQGTVLYSDKKTSNANPVTLPKIAEVKVRAFAARQAPDTKTKTDAAPPTNYKLLEILSPHNEQTIQNTAYVLNMQVGVQPKVNDNHALEVLLDNAVVARWTSDTPPELKPSKSEATSSLIDIVLNDVFRGSHTLQVRVVDAQSHILIESQPIVFFMHQTSILLPAATQRP